MSVRSAAGKAIGFLGKNFERFGRLNPLLAVGLTGIAIGGVVYKQRRDEKRISEKIEAAFRNERREQSLWNTVRSQVAGASEDLYKTYTVYEEGKETPSLHRGHTYKKRKGERIDSVRPPDVEEAFDLLRAAIENLLQSKVGEISSLINKVKRPDYAGIQKQLSRYVEETIKPVISDLTYVIDRGAARIREDAHKGFFKKRAV